MLCSQAQADTELAALRQREASALEENERLRRDNNELRQEVGGTCFTPTVGLL